MSHNTYITVIGPSRKVWMIDSSLWTNMLSCSNNQPIAGSHVYHWLDSRILLRYPYRHWEAVCCAVE